MRSIWLAVIFTLLAMLLFAASFTLAGVIVSSLMLIASDPVAKLIVGDYRFGPDGGALGFVYAFARYFPAAVLAAGWIGFLIFPRNAGLAFATAVGASWVGAIVIEILLFNCLRAYSCWQLA